MNIEILAQSILPLSIHGVNPRKIMGDYKWKQIKKEKQKEADHHCMCCGEYVEHVPGNYLECHELYDIDLENREFRFKDVVCICKKCHQFIHSARTKCLVEEGEITQEYFNEIMERGNNLLMINGLEKKDLSQKEIKNPKWVLVYENKRYNNKSF